MRAECQLKIGNGKDTTKQAAYGPQCADLIKADSGVAMVDVTEAGAAEPAVHLDLGNHAVATGCPCEI